MTYLSFSLAINVFAKDASMKMLAGQVNRLNNTYDDPDMMSAILDNHDTERFLTAAVEIKISLNLLLPF